MTSVVLAGQPNCGKSTLFNMLCGLNQHVANYPGVTVDKKSAVLKIQGEEFEIVDLPGTYAFSTCSLEERVAKTYLLDAKTDIIINIVDAANLRRHLYLTFQLLELGKPLILVLNMADVARRRGTHIDADKIAKQLKVTVVETVGSRNLGKTDLLAAIAKNRKQAADAPFRIDYKELEPAIARIATAITCQAPIDHRWLAIKALEEDAVILDKIGFSRETVRKLANDPCCPDEPDPDQALARARYAEAKALYHRCVTEKPPRSFTLTDTVDRIVLNRWLSFPILALLIFLTYQAAIVYGYRLTGYTWPLLAAGRNRLIGLLPPGPFAQVPLITDFATWMINSALALLNYIPIFFILFAIIAILEDVGYMPRMAFILDRVFRKYGLHGQSTLPLVLGGAMTGGCAVPGVMATRGIGDERARLATILTVPYMNCLAKVPFYAFVLGAFYPEKMGIMMFFISTVTLFIALCVARLLTATLLRNRETAPFVMEMPAYHLPSPKGVLLRAFQRVWLYIKKVMTVVIAVAVVLFALLQFPGIPEDRMVDFRQQTAQALDSFDQQTRGTCYHPLVDEPDEVSALLRLHEQYKTGRMLAKSKEAITALNSDLQKNHPELAPIIQPRDPEAQTVNRALRSLSRTGKSLQIALKNEKISASLLGMLGRAMEPLSRPAGFDWRVNVAFLSSFAARESAVATLGSIYQQGRNDAAPEAAMAGDGAYTPIHAVALLLFMIFSPPCIATMVVVKLQSDSFRWMLFAIIFPTALGLLLAALFFNLALQFGWSGIVMMRNFYLLVVALTLLLGVLPTSPEMTGKACS